MIFSITRQYISVYFIILTSQIFGQASDPLKSKILSPQEMKEDLDLYHQLLTETHPGLHRYLSTSEFDQTIDSIENQISDSLPFYDFYRLLAGLAADIRCAHTYVLPKKDALAYANTSCKLFPFFVYPIDDKLYVLFNGTEDTTITPGTELVNINGMTVNVIRSKMNSLHFRDGRTRSVLRRFMQGGYFSLFYYFYIEQPIQYEVTFKKTNGEIIKKKIPGHAYAKTEKNYRTNPVNSKMMSYYNRNHKSWDFEILDNTPSTALIRLAKFGGKGMNSEEKAKRAMQKFMGKVLRKIKQNNIENLIVELRGNSGGWDIQGQELLSFLTHTEEAIPYYTSQIVTTTHSDFLDHSDIPPDAMAEIRSTLEPQQDGTYALTPAGNATLNPVNPKEDRFAGSVYILVDEQCASTCAEVTAVAKEQQIGLILGNETGGAYQGGNSGSFIHYHLPNSGIYSSTPLVRYHMATSETDELGRGTMPDHQVVMSLDDLLTGRDATRELVFDLIRDK